MPPSFIARAGSRLAFPSTPTSHFAMPCMHRLAACELTCTLGTQVTTEVLIEHTLQAVGHCIEVWLAINVCPMYAFAQKSILVGQHIYVFACLLHTHQRQGAWRYAIEARAAYLTVSP
jgi:hypothetical protein